MACDARRAIALTHFAQHHDIPLDHLENTYARGRANPPGTPAQIQLAKKDTARLMTTMQGMGLALPMHGTESLPKRASHSGYAAVMQEIDAAVAGTKRRCADCGQFAALAHQCPPKEARAAAQETRRQAAAARYPCAACRGLGCATCGTTGIHPRGAAALQAIAHEDRCVQDAWEVYHRVSEIRDYTQEAQGATAYTIAKQAQAQRKIVVQQQWDACADIRQDDPRYPRTIDTTAPAHNSIAQMQQDVHAATFFGDSIEKRVRTPTIDAPRTVKEQAEIDQTHHTVQYERAGVRLKAAEKAHAKEPTPASEAALHYARAQQTMHRAARQTAYRQYLVACRDPRTGNQAADGSALPIDTPVRSFADFSDPQLQGSAYHVNTGLDIPTGINRYNDRRGTGSLEQVNPLRTPKWSAAQQGLYVEHLLQGGQSGATIKLVHADPHDPMSPAIVLDGVERLHAIDQVLQNRVPVFGKLLREYPDHESAILSHGQVRAGFALFRFPDTPTAAAWHVAHHTAGARHSTTDLDQARALLDTAGGPTQIPTSGYANLRAIPRLGEFGDNRTNQSLDGIVSWAARQTLYPGLDADPPWQRGYVWSRGQQQQYLAYVAAHGESTITVNEQFTRYGEDSPAQIIDGKQRLNAMIAFIRNEIPLPDGSYFRDFEDSPAHDANGIRTQMLSLKTERAQLEWYINMNSYPAAVQSPESIVQMRRIAEGKTPA